MSVNSIEETRRCWGPQWLPQETVICQWLFHHRVKQNVWLIKQAVRLHHNQMTTAKWSEKKMWWKPDQAESSKFPLGFVMMTHKVYHKHAHGLWPVVWWLWCRTKLGQWSAVWSVLFSCKLVFEYLIKVIMFYTTKISFKELNFIHKWNITWRNVYE